MDERDRKIVEAARNCERRWHTFSLGDLVAIIDRLDKQLAELRRAGEPFVKITEILPNEKICAGYGLIDADFRRLTQALDQIEEVKG